MSTTTHFPRGVVIVLTLALAGLGCEPYSQPPTSARQQETRVVTGVPTQPAALAEQVVTKVPEAAESPAPPAKVEPPGAGAAKPTRVRVGKNVYFERIVQGDRRRVIIDAYVCLREGPLEQLMCRRHTKEHEAILAADVDARDIHTALLAAKAKPGSTVRYEEKDNKPVIIAPTGQRIKVTLQFEEKGKVVTVPAQHWVRNIRTKKELEYDWVFAGSHFIPNPDDKNKPPFYAANSGDVITVSNFEGAMLDLPINSSKDNDELQFEAFTDHIPPLDTKVTIILEPMPDLKKK